MKDQNSKSMQQKKDNSLKNELLEEVVKALMKDSTLKYTFVLYKCYCGSSHCTNSYWSVNGPDCKCGGTDMGMDCRC